MPEKRGPGWLCYLLRGSVVPRTAPGAIPVRALTARACGRQVIFVAWHPTVAAPRTLQREDTHSRHPRIPLPRRNGLRECTNESTGRRTDILFAVILLRVGI